MALKTFEVVFNFGELQQLLFLPEKPLKVVFECKSGNVILCASDLQHGLFEITPENCKNLTPSKSQSFTNDQADSLPVEKYKDEQIERVAVDSESENKINSMDSASIDYVCPAGNDLVQKNCATTNDLTSMAASSSLSYVKSQIKSPSSKIVSVQINETKFDSNPCENGLKANDYPIVASDSSDTDNKKNLESFLFELFMDDDEDGDDFPNDVGAFDGLSDNSVGSNGEKKVSEENEEISIWVKKCVICMEKETPLRNLYRFPTDPELSNQWAEKCGSIFQEDTTCSERHEKFRICSDHFKPSDFDDNCCLLSQAVPSQQLKVMTQVSTSSDRRKSTGGSKCLLCLRKKSPYRILHSFPKDPVLSDKWAEVCGRKYVMSVSHKFRHENLKVCSDHFRPSEHMKKKLVPRAVPSRIPPAPSPDESPKIISYELNKSFVLNLKEKLKSVLNENCEKQVKELSGPIVPSNLGEANSSCLNNDIKSNSVTKEINFNENIL